MPFRLLDLAAEMRNSIYEYSLTHDRLNGSTATVALLQTYRQVHQEAKSMLEAQSTFTVIVKGRNFPLLNRTNDRYWKWISLKGDIKDSPALRGSVVDIFNRLPPAMARIPHIRFVLDLEEAPNQPFEAAMYYGDLSRGLFALANSLNSVVQARKLDVSIKNGHLDNRRIHGSTIVHLGSGITDYFKGYYGHLLQNLTRSPVNNSIGEFQRLERLRQLMKESDGDSPTYASFSKCVQKASYCLKHIRDWNRENICRLDVHLIGAAGLLEMIKHGQDQDSIAEPPGWLVICFNLTLAEQTTKASAQKWMKLRFEPLAHLVDEIAKQR